MSGEFTLADSPDISCNNYVLFKIIWYKNTSAISFIAITIVTIWISKIWSHRQLIELPIKDEKITLKQ